MLAVIIDKINYYAFILMLVCSAVSDRLLIFSFNFWLLTYIVWYFSNGPKLNLNKKKLIYGINILLYIFIVISFFYSTDKLTATKILETRLPLLIFPITSILGYNKHYNFSSIISALILGLYISIVIILSKAFIEVIRYDFLKAQYIVSPIEFLSDQTGYFRHRTYWGLWGILSLIGIFVLFENKQDITSRKYILLILSTLPILLFIFLLQARIITIVGILVIFLFSLRILKNKVSPLALYSLLFAISALGIVLLFARVNHFFADGFFSNMQYTEPRMLIWPNTFSAIRNNWFSGNGLGDATPALLNSFKQGNFNLGVINKYNAHNQFLQLWIESGIIPVGLLILSLIMAFFNSNKQYRFSTRIAIITLFLALCFESLLNRIAGVFIYSIVLVIFSFPLLPSKRNIDFQHSFGFTQKLITKLNKFLPLIIIVVLSSFFLFKPEINANDPSTYIMEPFEIFQEHNVLPYPFPKDANIAKLLPQFQCPDSSTNCVSHTIINSQSQNQIKTSIFCFVSKDFPGKVTLSIGNISSGFDISEYSFQKAEQWQKLEVSLPTITGVATTSINTYMTNDDTIALKGYVLIAFPEFN